MFSIEELWEKYLTNRWRTNYLALLENRYRSYNQLGKILIAFLSLSNLLPVYFKQIPANVLLVITISAVLVSIISLSEFNSQYEFYQRIKEQYQQLCINLKLRLIEKIAYSKDDEYIYYEIEDKYLEFRIGKIKIIKRYLQKAYEIVLNEIYDIWDIKTNNETKSFKILNYRNNRYLEFPFKWPDFVINFDLSDQESKYYWVKTKTKYHSWAVGGDGPDEEKWSIIKCISELVIRQLKHSEYITNQNEYFEKLKEEISLHNSSLLIKIEEDVPIKMIGK